MIDRATAALARWRARRVGSRFASNLASVVVANALAQAVTLGAAPVLSRLYGPEAFGAYGLFLAWVGIGLAVITARVEWLVPNPRSSTQAAALFSIGLFCTGLGVALSVMLLAGLPSSLWPGGWLQAIGLVWLLPGVLAGSGLQQLLQAWHVRNADLAAASRMKLLLSVVNVAVAVSFGLAMLPGATAVGLAAGLLAGACAASLGLLQRAQGLGAALRRLSVRRVAATWRRFRGQVAWSTLAALLNTLSLAAVPLMLSRHHSVADVGFYTLVQRIAFVPAGLVGSAVRESFWAEAARRARSDPAGVRALFLASLRRLGLLAMVAAVFGLAGPLWVGPLLGVEQWAGAGQVLAACVPMLVGQITVSPLSHLEVHGKQQWQAAWDAVRLVTLVGVIEVAGRSGTGLTVTVLAQSLVMGAMYGVLLLLNLRALSERGGLKP